MYTYIYTYIAIERYHILQLLWFIYLNVWYQVPVLEELFLCPGCETKNKLVLDFEARGTLI